MANCNFSVFQDRALLSVDLCLIFSLCFSAASKDTESLSRTEACSCLLIFICCLFPCSCLATCSQTSSLHKGQPPPELFTEANIPFYTHFPLKKTFNFRTTWQMHTTGLLSYRMSAQINMCLIFSPSFAHTLNTSIKNMYPLHLCLCLCPWIGWVSFYLFGLWEIKILFFCKNTFHMYFFAANPWASERWEVIVARHWAEI